VPATVVDDLLVHLVCENEEIVMLRQVGDSRELRFVEDAPGRVVRRIDDDATGCRGDGCCQRLGGDAEVVVRVELDLDGAAAGQVDHRDVRDPGGVKDEDIHSRLDERQDRLEERGFAARRDDHAVHRIDLDPVVVLELGGDRAAQRRGPVAHRRRDR
jgi:hypothetical protein